MKKTSWHTIVIGSGAAGLAAAVRLDALGVGPVAVYTEGLRLGTSINTGSDKQTYYKLGMYGAEADSPELMARDLMSGGSMHGDLALVESALSVQAFANLVSLGVPFPHDEFGQYIGYKTDHDPKRRATSCGPYTSREMCLALIEEVRRRNIPVLEHRNLVSLAVREHVCRGALFLNPCVSGDESPFEIAEAENVILATGGPGGLYAQSVYPTVVHSGAVGAALEAGAKARNLAESQFGLASVLFRWNVSGSYMQVLPRFISIDENGVEREFLRDYFQNPAELYDLIFLKGYQWPFAASHLPGSSLIDLFVFRETRERGRKVYLDYRRDPADLDWSALAAETRDYLERSGALGATPLERLMKLNPASVRLFAEHRIDLGKEPLQIAVCAQHNNGGLAGDLWWESENIAGLFPVGEVNGSHGVTRPGGTALNAGQCGAFRAAERIALNGKNAAAASAPEQGCSEADFKTVLARIDRICTLEWQEERSILQSRMDSAGGFLRSLPAVKTAVTYAREQLARNRKSGLGGLSPQNMLEQIRNEHLLLAQVCYLDAIRTQIESGVGSRGGAVVLADMGILIHDSCSRRLVPENPEFRKKVLETCWTEEAGACSNWTECRPLPSSDGWFETVWNQYRKERNGNE